MSLKTRVGADVAEGLGSGLVGGGGGVADGCDVGTRVGEGIRVRELPSTIVDWVGRSTTIFGVSVGVEVGRTDVSVITRDAVGDFSAASGAHADWKNISPIPIIARNASTIISTRKFIQPLSCRQRLEITTLAFFVPIF